MRTDCLLVSRSSLPYCIPTYTSVVLPPPHCLTHAVWLFDTGEKKSVDGHDTYCFTAFLSSALKSIYSSGEVSILLVLILLCRYYNFVFSWLLGPKSILWKSANGNIIQTIPKDSDHIINRVIKYIIILYFENIGIRIIYFCLTQVHCAFWKFYYYI